MSFILWKRNNPSGFSPLIKLYEWTKTRWIISLSQNKGQETIKKTSEGEKKVNLKDFEQTDIFNNIKNSFPDAELIDVKDNKDDWFQ